MLKGEKLLSSTCVLRCALGTFVGAEPCSNISNTMLDWDNIGNGVRNTKLMCELSETGINDRKAMCRCVWSAMYWFYVCACVYVRMHTLLWGVHARPCSSQGWAGLCSSFTSVGLGRSIQALTSDPLQLYWAGIEPRPGSCNPWGLSSLNHCEIMFVKFCCTHWAHILSQLGALQCDSKACKGMSKHFGVFESRHCCPCRCSLLFS